MLKRSVQILSLATLLLALPAYPWGNDGHHTVGAIADQLIHGRKAEQHVRDLLAGESLQRYAIWADCAKGYCRDWFDEEMRQFVQANPKHHDYHFTDIPVEEDHYSDTSVGASDDDIVHIMVQCIEVLRGNNTPVSNPHGFSERIALILLAHFVGDIHQPLHVGAAYLAPDDTLIDPNQSGAQYEETHGGNYLMLLPTTNLHAYWDADAVKRAMAHARASDAGKYAAKILQGSEPDWQTAGDIASWPNAWASEILPLARDAYTPLRLGPRHSAHDRSAITSNGRSSTNRRAISVTPAM